MELPWGINVSCYSYCLIPLDLASSYLCGSILKQAWMQLKQGDWSKATIHTLDSSQCVFRYLNKYLTLKHDSSIWLQVGRQRNRPFWSHWSGKWDPFTWAFFESCKGFSAESRSGKTNGCIPCHPSQLCLIVKLLCVWDCRLCPCCTACSSDDYSPMCGAVNLSDGYKWANLVNTEGQDHSCPPALTCFEQP